MFCSTGSVDPYGLWKSQTTFDLGDFDTTRDRLRSNRRRVQFFDGDLT